MTTILRGSDPDILTLYSTHPLEPGTVETLKSDFALAAHDRHDPLVKLRVSDRTDFYGCTPEEIRRRLEKEAEEEGKSANDVPSFLVADAQTNDDKSVIYAGDWTQREGFSEGALVEQPNWPKEGKLPFLEKLRVYMHYAPVLHVNLSIVNYTIPELWEYPYDPTKPMTPPIDGGADWRTQPPPPAYVVASPKSFVVSDDPENTADFMPRPDRVYKLTDDAAERLGLTSRWTVGWHDARDPQGHMRFAQGWKTN
ncbi:hypothetical protein GLOTRDRAFT_121440 [Gloeophyllum trabeum ATCC 11539]|uniref:Uncharacterized protein n=1 Tax=Gloeophyllum trabeum (strain ATCC 11539 / FP-39264 / Madison 617) TaxID=670483 RepID=S7Q582_GLOTA|nr:uncharacterized protein GLOTRDRAFT_121440 [Gloeophyllum trabeum ATCC 11539]EPQ55196.1 hypothetical protein GLOTRDRAFT_121440 [Gloeophyllum trabeum ATCC 11539]